MRPLSIVHHLVSGGKLTTITPRVSPVRMDPPGNYLLFGQDTGIHQADAPKLFDTSSRW
jgi:hypothetical protein